jgi:hypothetical protein
MELILQREILEFNILFLRIQEKFTTNLRYYELNFTIYIKITLCFIYSDMFAQGEGKGENEFELMTFIS